MKRFRKINNVTSPDHEENDKENDMFDSDSEPDYHQVVTMLAPDLRNDLICWLNSIGFLRPAPSYHEAIRDANCTDLKRWRSANGQYGGCLERRSVRDESIFSSARCSLNAAIKILLGWCKGHDVETVAKLLGVKDSIVGQLYIEASNVANKCMRSNIVDWQLGGPGVVVIIDTYPEGCTNTNLIRMGRPILCMSEIKSVPQKYCLEVLNHFQKNNLLQIADRKKEILRIVQTFVRPGSILITPFNSTLCSYDDFTCLRTLYPTIVNTGDLARHDDSERTLFSNLGTIWKSVLDVCEVAQFYDGSLIQQFIVGHMWRRRYAEESFNLLLCELSSMQ